MLESVVNSLELFVVELIVKLHGLHGARVESDWMKVAILHSDLRQDGGDGIIGTIGFHHYRKLRVKVDKNRRCRESMLKALEGSLTGGREERPARPVPELAGGVDDDKPPR